MRKPETGWEFAFVKKNVSRAAFFVHFRTAVVLFSAPDSWYNRDKAEIAEYTAFFSKFRKKTRRCFVFMA